MSYDEPCEVMHGSTPAPQSGPPSQIQSCCDVPGMQDAEHRAEIVVGNSVTLWKCSKISSNVHLNSCWKAARSDGTGVRRVNRRQSLTVDVVILVEQHHRRLVLANDVPECPRSQLVDAGPVGGTSNNQHLSDCRGARNVVVLTQGCCRRH